LFAFDVPEGLAKANTKTPDGSIVIYHSNTWGTMWSLAFALAGPS
jgi:hypothetical protein